MHVAIIPDGNRRYMRQYNTQDVSSSETSFENLIEWGVNDDTITHMSVFCWSTENWKRDENEIKTAMDALHKFLHSVKSNDSIHYTCCSTSLNQLPCEIIDEMKRINNCEMTKSNNVPLCIYLYISYGFNAFFKNGHILELNVNDDDIPQVDMLIRTAGEYRTSNFCMHKLAYSEIVFVDRLFPACTMDTWEDCMRTFKSRSRRFGK